MIPQLGEFSMAHWQLISAFFGFAILLSAVEIYRFQQSATKITPQQAVMMLNRQTALILDIRAQETYNKAYIRGSINLPEAEINSVKSGLEKYSDKIFILVTDLGKSSYSIFKALRSKGWRELYELKGGIAEWESAQLPVIKKI